MPPLPIVDDSDLKWFMMDEGTGGGISGSTVPGGGVSGPFIPTFSGGNAPAWGGLPQSEAWSPFRRRIPMAGAPALPWGGGPSGGGIEGFLAALGGGPGGRMARPMMAGGGGGIGPGGGYIPPYLPPYVPGGGTGKPGPGTPGTGGPKPPGMPRPLPQPIPISPPPTTGGTPYDVWDKGWNPAWGIWTMLQNAVRGGDPNYGGAFGLNPPRAIMDAMRSQRIQDAGAEERAARLGLQSRGDADPSTYGFQALQSQLGGQDRTARTMGAADLSLRQGQLGQYWKLLESMLREGSASDRAWINPGGGGGVDWASIAAALAKIAGSL